MKSKVTNELWVVQSNEMASAQAVEKVKKSLLSLSLTDRRLMAMLIAKVDPFMTEAEFPMMQVSVTEFQQMNGLEVGAGRAFDALKDSIITLMGTVIQFPDHENPKRRRMAQLLADGEYIEGEGYISVQLHKRMKPMLCELKRDFFKYRLETLGRLHSVYALRLYEFLKSKENLDSKMIRLTVPELRVALAVPDGKLKRFNQLKERALDPAIDGVCKSTDLHSEAHFERGGRGGKVKAVVLRWSPQKAKQPKSCKAPKVGFKTLDAAGQAALWRWVCEKYPQPDRDPEIVGWITVSDGVRDSLWEDWMDSQQPNLGL